MVFIRKIKTKNGIRYAEVESKRINGKIVQKHIRYIGREFPEIKSGSLKKEAKFLRQLEIIKRLDEGKSKEDLALLFKVTTKTIGNIKKRFDEKGIEGLIHTRSNKYETIKISTSEQAAIITEVVKCCFFLICNSFS